MRPDDVLLLSSWYSPRGTSQGTKKTRKEAGHIIIVKYDEEEDSKKKQKRRGRKKKESNVSCYEYSSWSIIAITSTICNSYYSVAPRRSVTPKSSIKLPFLIVDIPSGVDCAHAEDRIN